MTDKSKFVLNFDASANEVNERPNLKGSYKLAGEDSGMKLALWGRRSDKTGKTYARGQATPESVSAALRAKGETKDFDAPPGIEIKVGEAVLFENDKATKDNKWPNFRGYAREANRYIKLSGWEHEGGSITGDAEIYMKPSADGEADFEVPSDVDAERPLGQAAHKAPTAEFD